MAAAKRTTYLISGANKGKNTTRSQSHTPLNSCLGIGRSLVTSYLSRRGNTVIATVRDPTGPSSRSLAEIPKASGSTLIVVKIESTSHQDAKKAVQTLDSKHQISTIDVVIANAATENQIYGPLSAVDPAQVEAHISVNTIGPLLLFQAVLPLLQRSPEPRFVLLGSPLGSIGGMENRPLPMGAYGVSKAAAHYLIRKIHFENEWLVAFAVDPGFVQTEAGNTAARAFGMAKAPTSVQESREFLVNTIGHATREGTSGHFPSIEGKDWPW